MTVNQMASLLLYLIRLQEEQYLPTIATYLLFTTYIYSDIIYLNKILDYNLAYREKSMNKEGMYNEFSAKNNGLTNAISNAIWD